MLAVGLPLLSGASGFVVAPATLPTPPVVQRHGPALCSLGDDDGIAATRRALLGGGAAAALSALGGQPAWARLGIETTPPKDAEKDDELMGTDDVKKSLENVKKYKAFGSSLKEKFASDSNMPLIPPIRAEFDFSKVRTDLNVLTSVFDDQTQLTTDRISRAILYDLTELENASRFGKKGDTERTPKKIATVEKWFGKLDNDLTSFLSYF